MQLSTARFSSIESTGFRLDCRPFVGPAIATKLLLKKLPNRKDELRQLTAGPEGGIFNGPHFGRTFVDSSKYGVPFLGSSAMLQADLSDVPLLSNEEAHSEKLKHLEIKPGMSLVSCSGTIGKMTYARPEMAGMWSSQHIMKIQPDPDKILSGFLYAFLSSKYGVPLLVSGTYGSIIQSIAPEHIEKLPVPRLSPKSERAIHDLIEEAAVRRSEASKLKRKAIEAFESTLGIAALLPAFKYSRPYIGQCEASQTALRMDSTYYVSLYADARTAFDKASTRESRQLDEISEVFIPTIFKREYVGKPTLGYPYITGADVFCVRQSTEQFLVKTVAHENRLLLQEGMIVLHEAGQRYGLIGRAVMIGKSTSNYACTNNMVRIVPREPRDAGYIFSALCSEAGLRLIKREAAGSSIPHLDQKRIALVRIPWPKPEVRWKISDLAHRARANWDAAVECEDSAYQLLDSALTSPC